MKIQLPLHVELDSGETYVVVADQRDLAAVEARDDLAGTSFARARFLAWNVAHRTKRYTGTWEKWNAVDCAEVESLDDEAGAGEGLDPGRPDQSAAT